MRRSNSKRFSPMRRLLSFPILRAGRRRAGTPLSEKEFLFDLAGDNPDNLLFGRFGQEEVRGRIREAGILAGLARRGYHDPSLVLECGNPEDQRVSLYAGKATRDRLLLEVRLQIRSFHPGKTIGSFPKDVIFRMLLIHWLLLSDPERPFSITRPRLPGQERPGLSVLPQCLSLLKGIGREFLLDGVLDIPDHFHAALFYSRKFKFLDPRVEGRFQAIARNVKGIPLALSSEAIQEECLIDTSTGMPVPWKPAEQVMPLRDPLRRYLASFEYRRARDEASSRLRVAVDWDLYRAKIAAKGGPGKYP